MIENKDLCTKAEMTEQAIIMIIEKSLLCDNYYNTCFRSGSAGTSGDGEGREVFADVI